MTNCNKQEKEKPCCRRRGRAQQGASVEPVALAALLLTGGHGYDMRKTIIETTDGQLDVDVGGLYRSLRRLEEEGAVVSSWSEDHGGPARREYELTEQGIELAEQWLDTLKQREKIDHLLGNLLKDGLSKVERS